jgi:hypothetical protein
MGLVTSYGDSRRITDVLGGWGVGCLFPVLRLAQEFFTYMETSLLPVKGCKI